MGFYGNVTNENKTSFKFDRIYPNRATMDKNASSDGIFPGRFVLVDYDTSFNLLDYGFDPNVPYWMYNDVLCSGMPKTEKFQSTTFYIGPNKDAEMFGKTIQKGACVRVQEDRIIKSVNLDETWFIEVGAVVVNPQTKEERIQGKKVTSSEFIEYWKKKGYTFKVISPNVNTYKPGMYFLKDGDKYTIDTSKVFNSKKEYYTLSSPAGLIAPYAATDRGVHNENVAMYVANQTGLAVHDIIMVPAGYAYVQNQNGYYLYFYADKYIYDSSGAITGVAWSQISDGSTNQPEHYVNYNIDVRTYPSAGRGYDSTAWQKIIRDGKDEYVMVAELNSVVPTFDIESDAPTQIPLIPHFDKDGTNIYYKIHMQPQWGLRTKAASKGLTLPQISPNGDLLVGSTEARKLDEKKYPSDQTTEWERHDYNKFDDTLTSTYYDASTGKWTSNRNEDTQLDAAIYFNKDGFSSSKIAYSNDIIDEAQTKRYDKDIADGGWTNENKIELTPTGLSGNTYPTHNNSAIREAQEDTQELSIMLPAIGDSMAKIWDLVYGGRDTNLEIAKSNQRNTDIKWENARGRLNRKGLRLTGNGYETNDYNIAEVDTLAGCINSAHDLMGMIVNPDTADNLTANMSNLDTNQIFYVQPAVELAKTPEGKALVDKAGGGYVMKQLTYEFKKLSSDEYKFESAPIEDSVIDKSKYWVLENGVYRPAKETDQGPFYIQTVKPEVSYPPIGLTAFDGTKYYYKDVSADAEHSGNDPKKQDYIADPKYREGVDYYTFAANNPVKVATLSGNYEPGKFYLKHSDGSFYLDFNESSTLGETYYEIDPKKIRNITDNETKGSSFINKHAEYDGIYIPGKYYYKDNESYHVDMTPNGTIVNGQKVVHYGIIKQSADDAEKPVYVLQVTYLPISYENVYRNETDGVPDEIEYYTLKNNRYEKIDKNLPGWLNQNTQYFTRSESYVQVQGSVIIDEGKELNLTPYAMDTFYEEEYDTKGKFLGYRCIQPKDITGESNQKPYLAFGYNPNGGIYPFTIQSSDWTNPEFEMAVQVQSAFYTPHEYHYEDRLTSDGKVYKSYLLDNYLSKTHDDYYKFTIAPSKVTGINFYDPYKYYTKNPVTGEWELATGDFDPNKDYAEKKTFYVIEDKSGIFQAGAEWNPNVTNVPPGVTLGRRVEKYEFRVLDGFARNLNTLHGLILKINQLLLLNDKYTRDKRTFQGVVNKINDMIAQFGELKPGHLALVDNYGRLHSSDWDTKQASTIGKIKTATNTYDKGVNEDRFPQVNSVGEMRKQWITMNTHPSVSEPKITIHHNFQPVKNTTATANLNTAKMTDTDNTDQISLYTPIVDEAGHVVGNNKTKVTLPYGFKTLSTSGSSTGTTNPTATVTSMVADSTQDTVSINPSNKWIRTSIDASTDTMSIGHEVHAITTTAKSETDLDTTQTFTVQDTQFDAAGHITHNQTHTYKLPDGFKFVNVGAASAATANGTSLAGVIEADNHIDTLAINPANKWITLNANTSNDTLTIGHGYAGAVSQNDTQNENQTPNFGATFNIPYNGFDEAGHLSAFGTKTVKIPQPSLNTATGDVVTGLTLAPTTGKFTMTKQNVGTIIIADYVLPTSISGGVSSSDSINGAFGKLQYQVTKEISDRIEAINQEAQDRKDADDLEITARQEAINKEVEDRNAAINSAINQEVKDRNTAISNAINTEVSNRNDAIEEAIGDEVVARNEAIESAISTEVENRNKAIDDKVNNLDFEDTSVNGSYISKVSQTDGKISVERTELPSYVDDAAEDDNKYVHSVTQSNGKIEVIRRSFGDMAFKTKDEYIKRDDTFEYPNESPDPYQTIEWLFRRVSELEARIVELENPPQTIPPTK